MSSGGWQDRPRNPAYNTQAWKTARAAALRRANNLCELRLPGVCTRRATQVDHVLGIENDPGHTHLRAVCAPCHAKVTAQQGVDARRRNGNGNGRRQPDPPCTPRTKWLSRCVAR